MRKKEFFINAIRMVEVDGSTNIPTAVHYAPDGEVLIGSAAFIASKSSRDTFTDFKIDLGNVDPSSPAPERALRTIGGRSKSSVGFTRDFLQRVLDHSRAWLAENGVTGKDLSILLAEPLAMQTGSVKPDWLPNYRRHLERLLTGLGFESVDFLPEPFAVFQYYRYGTRHPIVAEAGKKQALVVDFGGGTFDVCVIETAKSGDISESGRNSKPLAASSEPVGGFYLNQMIAEELLARLASTKDEKRRLRKALDIYHAWRKNPQDLSALSEEYSRVVAVFEDLIYQVEDVKLALCKNIQDWRLDAPLSGKAPISIENPFVKEGRANLLFSESELREIFVARVWERRLKRVIQRTLERGREELQGAPISVVLLSGGSANIGWLGELVEGELMDGLGEPEILRLPDYQEVVAKGLAVECVRRFFNSEGDFSGVTYNRLCLILDPDGNGPQVRRFAPRTDGLPTVSDMPGVLLPSASVLKRFIDRPMRWRVKLEKPPRRHLNYYFLRSSINPEDIENLQNVEETRLASPQDAGFDAFVHAEVIVKQDGTSRPRFIYSIGRTDEESTFVDGKPFYLDMTYGGGDGDAARTYLGLDFGTSNTSVSAIDQLSIQVFTRRSGENAWNELSDLVGTLPYPLAAPLAFYIGQRDASSLVRSALEFFEGGLSLASYVAYLEHCANLGTGVYHILKGLTQRSAGPLWSLLRDCLNVLGSRAVISAPYKELLAPELHGPVDEFVDFLARYKHGKGELSTDTLRPVQILANISQKVYTQHLFGFFHHVQKERFGRDHSGYFRRAHGNPPFVTAFKYQGQQTFSDDEAHLIDLARKTAIPLHPLVFWDHCKKHPELDGGHCYLFDKAEKGEGRFSFKAVGFSCTAEVSVENKYASLARALSEFLERDRKVEVLFTGELGILA